MIISRNKGALLLTSALLLFCFPVDAKQELPAQKPVTETRQKVFNAESFMLDNGMEVIVVPNHRAPVVTHMVWYKAGAAQEPKGKSGIAHFMEHLMFKGSEVIGGTALAPGEFSKTIRRLGGQDNAFTSQDYTAYFQSVPSSALETVMRMEAGRMRGMNPPESEVDSERKVIIEERRQRTDNDPQARFYEQLRAHSFINHPYGTPIIGWMHEMEKLSRADVMAFYQKWYAPNNAILVVTGDVTPGDVFAKAIDIYGPIPKSEGLDRNVSLSPPMEAKTRLVMQDKAVKEPVITKIFRVPSARQDKKTSLALDVLNEIMGGGPTSRIYQALVVDQKIASSAGLSYDGAQWSDAVLSVFAVPVPGQSMETLEKALNAEIAKLIAKGVSADEVSDAITRMQDRSVYARDSLSGPAMIIGRSLASGLTLDDVEYWPHDLAAITREDIQKAAAAYLKDSPVTGVLLPEGKGE